MRALNIHEVNDVRLDPKAPPKAGDNDVVVKMKAVGICGSDLTYIKYGGIMRKPGGVTPLGHEGAGEVVQVGKAVEGISVGQRVIINPMQTSTFIGSGGPEGAFSDEVLVGDARLNDSIIPMPADLPYEVAALTEPLAVALHGVNRAEAKAGDKIVVFGCGPIGLGMVLWLVDRDCNVVALDLADERLARAKALGATHVFNPSKVNLREALMEVHGKTRTLTREAVDTDAYIDAAGGPTILNDVINMAKYHARMVVTAAVMKPVEINLGAMLTTEMTITTAMGYPTEMNDVVAALPRIKEKAQSLISHRLPFDEVIEGLKIAATPQSAKVMIEFEGASA
jgi:(R,R)-butanediol dehydrogenase/meso-butanediol dehydrogenase/diacetyl reductase